MRRSTDQILVTHAGSLPRPDDVRQMVAAKADGQPFDEEALEAGLQRAVSEAVRSQLDAGIDSINDGEQSKTNFTNYARERLSGWEMRTFGPGEGPEPQQISGRDRIAFPEYFALGFGQTGNRPRDRQLFCIEPIAYAGQDAIQGDIRRFKAALQGVEPQEAFLPAVAPGSIEHWLWNEHYSSTEEFLFAIADAMHQEYKAITDAGFLLQIDDPDLADAWQIHPELSIPEYRKFAALRIEALNHALRDIPQESIRLHVCWGSYHGPHRYDVPLKEIVDVILGVKAQAYSIEASNPCHEHEWRVWEDTKLPEGKTLIPGVVGHSSDFVEHPELVAQRLVRCARLVGRENVMAGTDCGLGTRVGHAKIVWAKFESMAEGARLASKELWG